MQPSIPANQIVSVVPGVLSAGGTALAIIGLVLSTSTRVPIGTVSSFPSAAAVSAYFGSNSTEATIANIYFNGFDGAHTLPSALLFSQYNTAAVGAYLRGGNIGGLSLTALQAISGTLSVVFSGATYTAGSLNLSAATTFSNAASIIQTALNATPPNTATMTASIATTVLTVTAVASGTIIPGQTLAGGTVTGGTTIVNQLTSTETDGHLGGKGTYTVSVSQSVVSGTLTTTAPLSVTYDTQSGGFLIAAPTTGALSTANFATGTTAATLLLTSATGAVTSNGAAIATPAAYMNSLIGVTQNWVSFMTAFDPDNGSGNTNKLAFAAWNSGQGNQFAYVAWDTDASPTTTVPATTSLGYLLGANNYSGTFPIWGPDYTKAAFALGVGAAIDFTQLNGRITYKFRTQSGLTPDVTNALVASNLAANGYNFYGTYATRSQPFNILANGVVSGPFSWMDTYINQIQLNNALQQAIFVGLTQAKSVPYNTDGYSLMEAWCLDPISSALNFGSIRAGVPLSAAQTLEVNQAAGTVISNVLASRGWYLQILPATAQVRASRGSPPATFWYMDGESVQKINLASIVVQ